MKSFVISIKARFRSPNIYFGLERERESKRERKKQISYYYIPQSFRWLTTYATRDISCCHSLSLPCPEYSAHLSAPQ